MFIVWSSNDRNSLYILWERKLQPTEHRWQIGAGPAASTEIQVFPTSDKQSQRTLPSEQVILCLWETKYYHTVIWAPIKTRAVCKSQKWPNIPLSQVTWEPAAVLPVTGFSSIPDSFLSVICAWKCFFLCCRTFLKIFLSTIVLFLLWNLDASYILLWLLRVLQNVNSLYLFLHILGCRIGLNLW